MGVKQSIVIRVKLFKDPSSSKYVHIDKLSTAICAILNVDLVFPWNSPIDSKGNVKVIRKKETPEDVLYKDRRIQE